MCGRYEEIKRDIANAPNTWLPALLGHVVETCRSRTVFRDDPAMLRFVMQLIEVAEQSEENREKLRKMYKHLTDAG